MEVEMLPLRSWPRPLDMDQILAAIRSGLVSYRLAPYNQWADKT